MLPSARQLSLPSRLFCSVLLGLSLGLGLSASVQAGPLTVVNLTAAVTQNQPEGIALTPDNRYAYRVNVGAPGSPGVGSVSMYSVDRQSGVLTSLGQDVPTGSGPTDVAVDPLGRFVFVPNWNDGTLSVYAIQADHTLVALPNSPYSLTTSAPQAVLVDPSGQYLYVLSSQSGNNLSFGASYLDAYSLQVTAGQPGSLQLVSQQATLPLATAGTNMALSPDASVLYAASSTNSPGSPTSLGLLFAFSRNPNTGVLTAAASIKTNTWAPGDVAVNPVNGLIYVVEDPTAGANNPQHANQQVISAYRYTAQPAGFTTLAGSPYSTVTPPRHLVVDPGGRYLYVAGTQLDSNSGNYTSDLRVFSLPSSGALSTPTAVMPVGIQPSAIITDSTGHLLYTANYTDNNGNGGISIYTSDAPTPVITSATVSASRLVLNAAITTAMGPTLTNVGFVYSTSPNFSSGTTKLSQPFSSKTFSGQVSLLDLQGNTTYYLRGFATTVSGHTYYGNTVTFTTEQVLNDMAAPSFVGGQLRFTDSYNSTYGEQFKAAGFMVVATANPQVALLTLPGSLSNKTFTASATLPLAITSTAPLSVRAFLTTASGATYLGNILPFNNAAIVTTSAAGAPGFATVALSGILRSDIAFSNYGFVYATTANPTTSNSAVGATSENGQLSTKLQLDLLTPATTYHVRAFAEMPDGTTVYGADVSFTNPVNITTTVTPGLKNAALSATLRNGLTSAAQGFVYGEYPNPSVHNSQKIEANLSGQNFSASLALSGLTEGKTYYFSSYATDSSGNTIYGPPFKFAYNAPAVLSVSDIGSINGKFRLVVDPRVKNIKQIDMTFTDSGGDWSQQLTLKASGIYDSTFGGLLLPNTSYNFVVRISFTDSTNYITSNTVPATTTAATLGQEMRGGRLVWLDAKGQHGLIAGFQDEPAGAATLAAAQKSLQTNWRLPTLNELGTLLSVVDKGWVTLQKGGYWSSQSCADVGGCPDGATLKWEWVMMMPTGTTSAFPPTNKYRARAVRSF